MLSDRQVLVHATLAQVSYERGQADAGDRFLILAGIAACHVGWTDVAEQCRKLVLRHNPRHLLGRYQSLPIALRSPGFAGYWKSLNRFCGYEQAEFLARKNGLSTETTDDRDRTNTILAAMNAMPAASGRLDEGDSRPS